MRRKRSRNQPFFLALLLLTLAGTLIAFHTIPTLVAPYLIHSMNSNGIYLSSSYESPTFYFTLSPPSVGLKNVHLQLRDTPIGLRHSVNVHLGKVGYILDATSSRLRMDRKSGSGRSPHRNRKLGRFITRFAQISWSDLTIDVLDPHPQPRIVVTNGEVALYAPSFDHYLHKYQNRTVYEANSKDVFPLSKLSLGHIRVATRTVTDISIPLTHPYIATLKSTFPFLFDSSSTMPGSLMLHPPHLSTFTPSMVFPAFYRVIKSLRHRKPFSIAERQDEGVGEHHTYSVPLPLPSLSAIVTMDEQTRRKMANISVWIEKSADSRAKSRQCNSIPLLAIETLEMHGRSEGGKGGCCSLRAHQLSDDSQRWEASTVTNTANVGSRSIIDLVWKPIVAIFTHPFYLVTFVRRVGRILSTGQLLDVCFLKGLLEYQIDKVELIDETPISSVTGRRLGAIYEFGINAFEDVMDFVL